MLFAQPQVDYLGHIISGEGVSTDPAKIHTMLKWPRQISIKELRGFLGLIGYYRRFIPLTSLLKKGNFAWTEVISKPLTSLLKKGNFAWTAEATTAFERLKNTMVKAPVLVLPDFSKPFTVEVDASGLGIGAILIQDHHPMAYLSQALNPKDQGLSTYEKELLALLLVVDKWRHYLQQNFFTVKTDHFSLKFLKDQRISTMLQHKGLTKLLGLNFDIQYRKGSKNSAADALSRKVSGHCNAITSIKPTWDQEVLESYQGDDEVNQLISDLTQNPRGS